MCPGQCVCSLCLVALKAQSNLRAAIIKPTSGARQREKGPARGRSLCDRSGHWAAASGRRLARARTTASASSGRQFVAASLQPPAASRQHPAASIQHPAGAAIGQFNATDGCKLLGLTGGGAKLIYIKADERGRIWFNFLHLIAPESRWRRLFGANRPTGSG